MTATAGPTSPWPPVLRVMGIETEYGISALGQAPGEDLHPMQLSNHVVKGYGWTTTAQPAGWDYETETPLRDIRGYELSRNQAHPDQLTDADLGMANVILTNGARLYVDHAHPEYSGPEVTNALDAVRYDKAGDAVMAIAAEQASQNLGRSVRLYKNNTDGKGASYGTHENYLLERSTPFDRVVTQFTGFLISRQVITGAGRVGVGQASQQPGFQISQRADFFEAEVGLETTLNRPIINTRDEPHADASRHRRLHVITGDANLSEISTYLKVGTASWVLRAIEAGLVPGNVRVDQPVLTMRAVSHDPTCRRLLTLADGRVMTAVDLQEIYLEAARTCYELRAGRPGRVGPDRGQGRVHPVAGDARRAAPGSDRAGRSARLGGQAAADGVLPRPRRSGLGIAEAGPDRSAVLRRRSPPEPVRRSGPQGADAPAGHRRRGRAGAAAAADRHPGLLPGPGDGEVRSVGGRGVLGLGDLRRPRQAGAATAAAARSAEGDPRPGRVRSSTPAPT